MRGRIAFLAVLAFPAFPAEQRRSNLRRSSPVSSLLSVILRDVEHSTETKEQTGNSRKPGEDPKEGLSRQVGKPRQKSDQKVAQRHCQHLQAHDRRFHPLRRLRVRELHG